MKIFNLNSTQLQEVVKTLLENIQTMDIESFKIYAKNNINHKNSDVVDAINLRLQKENLTVDDLQ